MISLIDELEIKTIEKESTIGKKVHPEVTTGVDGTKI